MSALALPWLDVGSSPSVVPTDAHSVAAHTLTFVTPMLVGMLAWEICTQDVATTLGALSRQWRQRPRRRRGRQRRHSGSIDSLSTFSTASSPGGKLIASSGLLDARWHTRVVRTIVHMTSFAARAAAACMLGVAASYMRGQCMSATWPRAVVGTGATATSLITLAVICNALLVVCDGGPRNMRLFAIVAAAWTVQVVLAYASLIFISTVGERGCPSLRIASTFGLFYVGALVHSAVMPILLFTRKRKADGVTASKEKEAYGRSGVNVAPSWRPGLDRTLTDQSPYSAEAGYAQPRSQSQRWPLVLNAINPLNTLARPLSNEDDRISRSSEASTRSQLECKTLILDDEDVFQAVRRAHFENGTRSSATDAIRIEALAAACVWVRSGAGGAAMTNEPEAQPTCMLRFGTSMAPFALWWIAATSTMIGGVVISFVNWSASATFLYFLISTVMFVLFSQRLTTPATRRILLDVVAGRRGSIAPLPINNAQSVTFSNADGTRKSTINQRRTPQTTLNDEHGPSFFSGGNSHNNVAGKSFSPLAATRIALPSLSSPPNVAGMPASIGSSTTTTGFREVKSDNSIRAKILSLVRNADDGAASRKAHNSCSTGSARISPSVKHISAGTASAHHSSASGRRDASSIELDRAVATLQGLPVAMITRDAEMTWATTVPKEREDAAKARRYALRTDSLQLSPDEPSLGMALERVEDELDSSASTEPSSDYINAQHELLPSSLQPRRKRAASRSGKSVGALRDVQGESTPTGQRKQKRLTRLSSHGSLERVEKDDEAAAAARTNRALMPVTTSTASHGGSEADVTGAFVDLYSNRASEETHSTHFTGHRASLSVPALPPQPPASSAWQEAVPRLRARPLSGGHILTTTVDSFGVTHTARIDGSRRMGGVDGAHSGSSSPKTLSDTSMHQRIHSLQTSPSPLSATANAAAVCIGPLRIVGVDTGPGYGTGASSLASFHSAAETAAAPAVLSPSNLSADAVLETMLSYDGALTGGRPSTFSSPVHPRKFDDGDDEVIDPKEEGQFYATAVPDKRDNATHEGQRYDLPLPNKASLSFRYDDVNSFKRDDDVSSIPSDVERKHQEALEAGIEEADEELLFQFIDSRGFHKDEGSVTGGSRAGSVTAPSHSGSQSRRRASGATRHATSIDDGASGSRVSDAWERKTESSFGLGDISGNPRLRSRQGSNTSKYKGSKSSGSRDSIAVQAANAVVRAAPHRQVVRKTSAATPAPAPAPAPLTPTQTDASPTSTSGGYNDSYFDPLAQLSQPSREALRAKRSLGHLTAEDGRTTHSDARSIGTTANSVDMDSTPRSPSGAEERGGIDATDTMRSGKMLSGNSDDAFHVVNRNAAAVPSPLTARHNKRNGRSLPRFPSYESNLARERLDEIADGHDNGKGHENVDDSEQSRRHSMGRDVVRLETVEDDGSVLSHRSNEKEQGSSRQAGVKKVLQE